MRFYEPKHYGVYELVPRSVYDEFHAQSLLFLDPRIIKAADLVREFFSVPCFINDWYWSNGDGGWQNRGFRTGFSPVGATYSQHKFGRALDIHVSGFVGTKVRKQILDNEPYFEGLITRMETDVPHLHIDCAPVAGEHIVTFAPKRTTDGT